MPTRWLVIGAVVAVLLALGLYGARAGWFGGEDENALPKPMLGQPVPDHSPTTPQDSIAKVQWGTPPDTPVVGVGSAVAADAPPQATLTVTDGRANVGIRVPRAKADGTRYTSYALEVRSGTRRVWGGYAPAGQAPKGQDEPILLSLNVVLLHSIEADREPLTVVVGGSAPRKGDTLGIVRLTLQPTP